MYIFLGNEKAEETEERLRSETDTSLGKLIKQVIISFLKAFLRLVGCRKCLFTILVPANLRSDSSA